MLTQKFGCLNTHTQVTGGQLKLHQVRQLQTFRFLSVFIFQYISLLCLHFFNPHISLDGIAERKNRMVLVVCLGSGLLRQGVWTCLLLCMLPERCWGQHVSLWHARLELQRVSVPEPQQDHAWPEWRQEMNRYSCRQGRECCILHNLNLVIH